MSETQRWTQSRLHDLDRQECRELLEAHRVGRVAFVTPGGPVVLPVNYVVTEDAIVFRTTPHGEIARQIDGRRAAFEVDETDDFTESGWSVLVQGVATFVESARDLPDESRPTAWADGIRSLFVRIRLETVTGRRLLPG